MFISQVHVLFLYCVTLEASLDSAFRYQIPEAFKALHKLCRALHPPLLSADQTIDYKIWAEDPYLWYNFGAYFLQDNEVLLARDAFALFINKLPPDDESATVEIYLTLAKNCANFQNYEEAVSYGDRALLLDGFHKETRSLLAEWSEIRKAELALQEDSATAILKVWRQRCWQPGYRSRYAKLVVNELEQTVAMPASKYDVSVRNELAYFARDKWRARFLFEDECARRIQRSFRGARMILSMQRAGREKYKGLANHAYAVAIKTPFDSAARAELRRIAAHRFCPRNHHVIAFAEAMNEQDRAHAIIRRSMNVFRLRKWVKDRIDARIFRCQLHEIYATIYIQKIVRMRLAIFRTKAMRKILRRRHEAARIIQRYYRNRNNSFRHSVLRMMQREKWKKDRAANLIVMVCNEKLKRRRAEKQLEIRENWAAFIIQRLFRRRKFQKLKDRDFRRKAYVIQAFFRGSTTRVTSQLARRLLRKRKCLHTSEYTNIACARIDLLDFSFKPYPNRNHECKREYVDLSSKKDLLYQSPGIRQNTPLFEEAMERSCVVCLGRLFFGPNDCMLLCSVLRHPLCRTQRLVFEGIDGRHSTFEFDLIQAIGKSVSLRSIVIIGGCWRPSFLISLFETVQKINPRVTEVIVEDLRECKISPSELFLISASFGSLVSDFFNYSVPGLRVLSLHGIGLVDVHLDGLMKGLTVNSSITNLILSNNMIEDSGFRGLIKAVSSNRRSLLSEIDLSWNLITGVDASLLRSLKEYKNPVFGKTLRVVLRSNLIRHYFDSSCEFKTDIILDYELEPIFSGQNVPKNHSRVNKNISGLQHSHSASVLSPVHPSSEHLRKSKSRIIFKSKLISRNIGSGIISLMPPTGAVT